MAVIRASCMKSERWIEQMGTHNFVQNSQGLWAEHVKTHPLLPGTHWLHSQAWDTQVWDFMLLFIHPQYPDSQSRSQRQNWFNATLSYFKLHKFEDFCVLSPAYQAEAALHLSWCLSAQDWRVAAAVLHPPTRVPSKGLQFRAGR